MDPAASAFLVIIGLVVAVTILICLRRHAPDDDGP